MNLINLFDQKVSTNPMAQAISMSQTGNTWNYQTLYEKSLSLSYNLNQLNIQSNDFVLVNIHMSLELYTVILALLRIGAIPIFVNLDDSLLNIEKAIGHYKIKAFIAMPKDIKLKKQISSLKNINFYITLGFHLFTKNLYSLIENDTFTKNNIINKFSSNDIKPEHTAYILCDSEQTILKTHANLIQDYNYLSQELDYDSGQVEITTEPLNILANLIYGTHSIIANIPHSIESNMPLNLMGQNLLNDIEQYRVTRYVGKIDFLKLILPFINIENTSLALNQIYFLNSLGYQQDLQNIKHFFPMSQIVTIYGNNNFPLISKVLNYEYTLNHAKKTEDGRGLFIGTPNLLLKIISSEFLPDSINSYVDLNLIECGTGKRGEIMVCASELTIDINLPYFLFNEQKWYQTGMAGFLDSEQKLWYVGAYNSRIHYQGMLFYPQAINIAFKQKGYNTLLIEYNHQPLLIIEKSNTQEAIAPSLLSLWGLSKAIYVEKIPTHKSGKINYQKLFLLVEQKNIYK